MVNRKIIISHILLRKEAFFMNYLKRLYVNSFWHKVYNLSTDSGKARIALLCTCPIFSILNGLTSGVFYTGLLVGYGINIVNISILTFIPYITSLFSLFTPYILERFQRRKVILSIARLAYFIVNILGITLLPQVVHSESGRIIGLIVIVFLANSINFLFTSGYQPWHMSHVTPDIRNEYLSSSSLVSSVTSGLVLVGASVITDRVEGQAQLDMIILMRYLSFAVALLDVFLNQLPKEPVYEVSVARPSLLNIFRLPLSDKKFRLTTLIYGLYLFCVSLPNSVLNAWLLEEVQTGFLFINVIDWSYCLFLIATTRWWSRFTRKHGVFRTMAISLLLHFPSHFAYTFVNAGNYIWLMTAVRLVQHVISLSIALPTNSLIYVNLPKADQTNYLSFYTIVRNVSTFLAMVVGTAVVAAMGENTWSFLGYPMGSVPTLMFVQSFLLIALALFIFSVEKKVRPAEEMEAAG